MLALRADSPAFDRFDYIPPLTEELTVPGTPEDNFIAYGYLPDILLGNIKTYTVNGHIVKIDLDGVVVSYSNQNFTFLRFP